jgi:hypothetical protein
MLGCGGMATSSRQKPPILHMIDEEGAGGIDGDRERRSPVGAGAARTCLDLGLLDRRGGDHRGAGRGEGVRRIVAISAQPVLRGGAGEPWWHSLTARPLLRTIYRQVYRDLERMERTLAAGDTDWTVLRPPYLTNDPPAGRYRTAMDANVPGWSLARGDLARAMLDVLDRPATIRRAVGVGPN